MHKWKGALKIEQNGVIYKMLFICAAFNTKSMKILANKLNLLIYIWYDRDTGYKQVPKMHKKLLQINNINKLF